MTRLAGRDFREIWDGREEAVHDNFANLFGKIDLGLRIEILAAHE